MQRSVVWYTINILGEGKGENSARNMGKGGYRAMVSMTLKWGVTKSKESGDKAKRGTFYQMI
jgi:hypothetical protein